MGKDIGTGMPTNMGYTRHRGKIGCMAKLRRSPFKIFKCSKCGIRPNRYWSVKTDYMGPGGIHTLIHRYCLICCFTISKAREMEANPVCSQSAKHGQMSPVNGGK
jgi:hypothetical protein